MPLPESEILEGHMTEHEPEQETMPEVRDCLCGRRIRAVTVDGRQTWEHINDDEDEQ